MTTIDKIRAEIERRKKVALDDFRKGLITIEALAARRSQLEGLSLFLDTLEEPVSEDLEEAAETKYPTRWKKYPNDGIVRSEEYFDLNAEKRDAFKAGAEWQKAKMMEGAVEGIVEYNFDKNSTGYYSIRPTYVEECVGDKVKIIIVKEEEL